MLNVLMTRYSIAYNPTDSYEISKNAVTFTVSYFIFDSMLCLFQPEYWIYLPHHMIAISLGLLTQTRDIPIKELIDYMFYIEFSNMFLCVWGMTRKYRHWNNFITPFLAFTYIPVRTFYLPVLTLKMIMSSRILHNDLTAKMLYISTAFTALQFMSWAYSYKLFRIFIKRCDEMRRDYKDTCPITQFNHRIAMILTIFDDRWWPVVTYIAKMYVSLYQATHYFPTLSPSIWKAMWLFLVVDYLHIVASIMFYMYNYVWWSEKLDNTMIHAKITAGGTIAFAAKGKLASYPSVFNLLLLLYIIYRNANTCKSKHKTIYNNKQLYGLLYIVQFCLSSYPLILYYDKGYIGVTLYILGGVLWALEFPEKQFKCRTTCLFNSLGWMHTLVIIADVTMCNIVGSAIQSFESHR